MHRNGGTNLFIRLLSAGIPLGKKLSLVPKWSQGGLDKKGQNRKDVFSFLLHPGDPLKVRKSSNTLILWYQVKTLRAPVPELCSSFQDSID